MRRSSAVLAGLFVAVTSCGGDAFSVATGDGGTSGLAPGGDAGSVADAHTFTDGEPGTSSNWCSRQGSHLFCEDFSEGFPGQLMPSISTGSAVEADMNSFPLSAAPQKSLVATTPALSQVAGSATAIGAVTFTTEGGHDVVQTQINVAGSCFAHGNKDGVTVAALSFSVARYLLGIVVQSNTAELIELTVDVDGGTSNIAVHPFSATVPLDRWVMLSLDANLGTAAVAMATVKLNNVAVLTGEKLSLVPALGARHPTLALGAAVKNTTSLSPGCRINVDEILFDLSAL